ncbi:MAG: carbohydrate-binding protein, partial [Oscillospiraceae bacterium]|nr:carbohydrate-binding protein [Oscillospiraceae bacterium]
RGHYFLNPGEVGMSYSNNHTHLHKFKGEYYIISHSLILKDSMKIAGGFRSLMADNIEVNEKKLEIELIGTSTEGAKQIEPLNPYYAHCGTEASISADIGYVDSDGELNNVSAVSKTAGSWLYIKGAKFKDTAKFMASVKGKGRIEIRIDSKDGDVAAAIEFDCDELTTVYTNNVNVPNGEHGFYIVFSDENIVLDAWEFAK